ncbi:hypothetical protein L3073_06815 [Ancylomarina sp. DW003]|nr:hypothetical protein [Ancylomarina sp. DW003]MDE5421914.1 hypothetical protein [Ancylomarina sp. DW003]
MRRNYKKVFLTFDYEMFLGANSGTVENCILKPTEMLIESFIEHNIKGTFFVDTLFIERLANENEKTKLEAEMINKQLKKLVELGSRIELHLHPHWLDANYLDGKWSFPNYDRYRLHSLSPEELDNSFESGINYLNSIGRSVKPDYQVLAFRAGGLCIQPFSFVKHVFKKYGIKIDSSVIPLKAVKGEGHAYDYSKVSESQIYRFDDDVCNKSSTGPFLEVPLTLVKKSFFDKLLEKVYKKYFYTIYGDGQGMNPKNASFTTTWKNRFNKKFTEHLTMDSTNHISFNRSISKVRDKELVLMCHPKFLSFHVPRMIRNMVRRGYGFYTLDELL